jgi:hypothetical protein
MRPEQAEAFMKNLPGGPFLVDKRRQLVHSAYQDAFCIPECICFMIDPVQTGRGSVFPQSKKGDLIR